MLLKVSLGLAILLGLATLFFAHNQVGGKINQLNEDLTTTRTELQTSQQSEARLRGDVRNLRADLEQTTTSLTEATNLLAQAQSKAQEQQSRADRAMADLNQATIERNTAQQELSQWRLFEMTPEQIRNNLTRLRQVERERDVFVTDNEILSKKVATLDRELRRYRGDEEPDIQLPATAKGNIVAVDPKYDFVIVDIGGNHGLETGAKLLVNRNGQLIGQVRITAVEPNRAIANVLPEWKQQGIDIMEGDQVIPSHVRL